MPILASEQFVSLSFQGASGQVTEETLPQLRALNPEKTASLTLNANALTVQVVEYEHFDAFLSLIIVCLQALPPQSQEFWSSGLGCVTSTKFAYLVV